MAAVAAAASETTTQAVENFARLYTALRHDDARPLCRLLRQKLLVAEQPSATREKCPLELAAAGDVAAVQRVRETLQDPSIT